MVPTDLNIAVIGGAECDRHQRDLAFDTGKEIARVGAVLLCGGRGGVMEAAAEGARSENGSTVGILPGRSRRDSPPNPYIQTSIFTGLVQARNQVLVLSADAVIGIGGGWGTLNEIGLALKYDKPVVLLSSWQLDPPSSLRRDNLFHADTAQDAVRQALEWIQSRGIENDR